MEKIKKNILIRGIDLTEEEKTMLNYNGMSNPSFVKCNSFYFDIETGKPTEGLYPVCTSLSNLPY